jgi:ammonia channel protein AmtB
MTIELSTGTLWALGVGIILALIVVSIAGLIVQQRDHAERLDALESEDEEEDDGESWKKHK